MALIENIQREDLNPLEEAIALQRLIDEFDLTHAQAADAVGRSRAAVSNLLRLLELPTEIRVLLETKALEMGHARALLTLAPQAAIALARQAAEHGWSVREVEHRAQLLAAGKVRGRRPRPSRRRPSRRPISPRWNASCRSRSTPRSACCTAAAARAAWSSITATWIRWMACWNACASGPNNSPALPVGRMRRSTIRP